MLYWEGFHIFLKKGGIRNMGLYRRKDSTNWWMVIRHQGSIFYYSTGTSDRKVAEKIYETVKAKIILNQWFHENQKNITFSEFFNQYDSYARGRIRSYVRSIYPTIRKWLLPYFGKLNLSEIDTKIVDSFQSYLISKSLSAASVNKYLAILKAMLSKAVHWNMCPDSILSKVRKVKPLKNVNKRLRYLSKEECFSLINACAKHLKPIVLTALLTGMRKSEILNLTWQQIDLKHGYILLDKTKNDDRREIPISKGLKKLLFSIPRNPEIPYVFYNPETKKPYTDVKTAFKNACKKAGIEDFHFHDLRHTFASYLVMNNTGLAVVKELLGHKDIKMTMRYSHLSPEHKVRAISNLENTLFSKDEKPSTVTIPLTVDKEGLTEDTKNVYYSISLGD